MTRVGSPHDGGYVIPFGVLCNSDYLLSFGLALNWEFERQFNLYARPKAVHCYDHSITKEDILELGANAALKMVMGSRPRKRLRTLKLAASYARLFGRPHVKHFPIAIAERDADDSRSMTTAIAILTQGGAGSVFLKCDIEGDEYKIMDQVLAEPDRVIGAVIEFHEIINQPHRFFTAVERLQDAFAIVHIHANNFAPVSVQGIPDVVEVSFVNIRWRGALQSSYSNQRSALIVSPSGAELDAPNSSRLEDIEIIYA
jgi:hypothetical protein